MKYIAYWENPFENVDELVKKNAELMAIYEKGTKDYPRVVYGPYQFLGEPRGFVILDAENPEQLIRWTVFYKGLSEWTFQPIYSTAKTTGVYLSMKK